MKMKPQNVLNVGMEGRFKLAAHKLDGTSRVVADWFENLILDSGLNRLGSGAVVGTCAVGTNSTAPATSQTALLGFLASTTTVNATAYGADAPTNSYAYVRLTYRFNTGVAAGNLSEVGVGWSNTNMFCRTLIKDGSGNPTTITILSDETLDVTWECRVYPNMSDQTFTINISGTNYTFTARPAQLTYTGSTSSWASDLNAILSGGVTATNGGSSYGSLYASNASLGPVTGEMGGTQLYSGTAYSSASFTDGGYVNNSLQRTRQVKFDLNSANVNLGGIRLNGSLSNYQLLVTPLIPKTSTNVLTLNWTVTWARKP